MQRYRRRLAERYARRFAESNMIATVRVTRMGEPVLDPATGALDASPQVLVYEGKARVYAVSGPMTYSLGEEPQYFSGSYVSIPLFRAVGESDPQVDDVVEVLADPDPLVVGRMFRVVDVESGGQFPSARRMQVTGVQRSRNWKPGVAPRDIPEEWRV